MLFVCAARSKQLPEGGNLTEEDWRGVVPTLRDALRFASTAGVLKRSPDARELWAEIYGPLSDGKPGMVGAVTSRAEAQVMRLAVIYACLDQSPEVQIEHLRAGKAVWDYCDASVQYIFGDALGDETADVILARLRDAGDEGLTRTDISKEFKGHKQAADIDRALALLASLGRAQKELVPTGGRPTENWVATSRTDCEKSEKSEKSPLISLNSLFSQDELGQNKRGGVE